jgi:hypothetical protein
MLDVVRESASLEDASAKLGATPEYLQAMVERYAPEQDPGEIDVEAFPLGASVQETSERAKSAIDQVIHRIPAQHQNIPPHILPVPKKVRTRWPGGAWSPSRFKKLAMCARNHMQKYGPLKRPDPMGLDAMVGNAWHGAAQDAGALRLAKRKGVPLVAGREELLYLLEHQPEVVHDHGTEVLKRARDITLNMEKPLHLGNVWAVEFCWSFHISPGFLVAGYADLIEVFLDPRDPAKITLVRITDYKTGPGQVPSSEDLRHDPQATLELIWGRRFFRTAQRVQFRLWNVNLNQEASIDWDQELEDLTLGFARASKHSWGKQIKTATVGNHCKYCPYRSDCKGYNEFLQKETFKRHDADIADMSLEDQIEQYYRYKLMADMADQRRKDFAGLILPKFGMLQKSHKTDRFTAIKKSRTNESIGDAADTLMKMSELTGINLFSLINACSSLNVDKLKAWIQTQPEHKQEIAMALLKAQSQRRSSTPWLEVRRKKPLF